MEGVLRHPTVLHQTAHLLVRLVVHAFGERPQVALGARAVHTTRAMLANACMHHVAKGRGGRVAQSSAAHAYCERRWRSSRSSSLRSCACSLIRSRIIWCTWCASPPAGAGGACGSPPGPGRAHMRTRVCTCEASASNTQCNAMHRFAARNTALVYSYIAHRMRRTSRRGRAHLRRRRADQRSRSRQRSTGPGPLGALERRGCVWVQSRARRARQRVRRRHWRSGRGVGYSDASARADWARRTDTREATWAETAGSG